MKKLIIITVFLVAAVTYAAVEYFSNLNPPGTRTGKVINDIPGSASIIFEFSNDNSFYDFFKGNSLFPAAAGAAETALLDTLRTRLLMNPQLRPYFSGQNIFISLHPLANDSIGCLVTLRATKAFDMQTLSNAAKRPHSGLAVSPYQTDGKKGYVVQFASLKKKYYIINDGDNVFSGSFSKELADECANRLKDKNQLPPFVLLSEQQNANSLASIYFNYTQLNQLFRIIFSNNVNSDIFKRFRDFSGVGTLTLNYKTDALMFNGATSAIAGRPASYLNLFAAQHPVINHLKDIFPSTTAYSISFSADDPQKFGGALAAWYAKAGMKNEEIQLFDKVKAETGVNIQRDFYKLLGNEFAIVTTRYFEKLAIISVKDGSALNNLLTSISKMTDANTGQLNYDQLPFFLLGDAYGIFKRPYFLVADNYLILANSPGELKSYYDSYVNRKFLSKNGQYQQFDNLLSDRSNVSFLMVFRNSEPIFKRDMDSAFYHSFLTKSPGWRSFYGASWQLSSMGKDFYTNFCMLLDTSKSAAVIDTVAIKK